MRTLTDPADNLLARADDLEIHTQHTMRLDSAPDFHGSSEDEENLFAGLSGKAPKLVRLPKKAGVKQVRPGSQPAQVRRAPAPRMGGFMPGMGDLNGPAPKRAPVHRVAPAPRMGGFMPGMGELSGPAAKRAPVRRAAPAPRMGGFMPGMGDFTIAGMGIGTLALIGVGAWLVLRRKRA